MRWIRRFIGSLILIAGAMLLTASVSICVVSVVAEGGWPKNGAAIIAAAVLSLISIAICRVGIAWRKSTGDLSPAGSSKSGDAVPPQKTDAGRLEQLLTLHLAVLRKNALKRITADNFTAVKAELERAWNAVARIGINVPWGESDRCLLDLRHAFENAVRQQIVREEQGRIKEIIREEERVAAEARKAIEQADHDQRTLKQALEIALRHNADERTEQIAELRQRLAEAEARGVRALSMAQQTKAGHVYIISNIGSLGEGVYKIGMTRRLEPMERVWELSSASVPFPFDVHALVHCDDAPALEHALHTAFNHHRLNKVNLRKEFFRADLASVMRVVEQTHGTRVDFRLEAEAAEFLASRDVKNEDLDYAAALTGQVGIGE